MKTTRINLWIGLTAVFCFVQGCAAMAPFQYFENDPELQTAAFQLADDYLKGQEAGDSLLTAKSKYGVGAMKIYRISAHECDSLETLLGSPAIRCRVKIKENGEVLDTPHVISFDYFESLRKAGDPYEGLRIDTVVEGRP